jgi:hypothetical protein
MGAFLLGGFAFLLQSARRRRAGARSTWVSLQATLRANTFSKPYAQPPESGCNAKSS